MKTYLVFFGALTSSALAGESHVSQLSPTRCCYCVTALPVLQAAETAKPAEPPAPTSPAPKPNDKKRGSPPKLPAHLFM